MNILSTLSYLVFPRFSAYSTTIFSYIDKPELQATRERLKKPVSDSLNMVYVSVPYKGQIADLLEKIKLGGEFDIAKELAEFFADRVWEQSTIFIPTPDIIVPVPADPKRYTQRGFHVASLFAQELCGAVCKDNESTSYIELLVKTKSTRPQSSLTKVERKKNYDDSIFQVNTHISQKAPYFQTIWLVDDIVATQSTLTECAKALKDEFPDTKIYAIVLAGN